MSVVFAGGEASGGHVKSSEVQDSALDLFTVPLTNIIILETILSHGLEEEEKTLKPQGYYSPLDYQQANLSADQITTTHNDYKALDPERRNAVDGSLAMRARTTGGKTIQLFRMPHVDLFNTGRTLIPGVDLKMRFTLNDPKFFVNRMAASDVNVRLQSGDLR